MKMKRTFKDRVESLGLNYSKELLIIILLPLPFLVGGLLIYYFFREIYISIIIGFIGAALDYFYISRYSTYEKKLEKEHVDELISLLSYFQVFISNKNNVYTSFKLLLPYCSICMEGMINSLLNQIDSDKSVGPYITFANKFNNHIVESLMLSIYQMVDNGENTNQLSEFELLFTNTRMKFQEDLIDSKKKSLETLNSFPLIGAGAITITLSLAIISIIGEYVNVI